MPSYTVNTEDNQQVTVQVTNNPISVTGGNYGPIDVSVAVPGPQGAGKLFIQNEKPAGGGSYMWVQTGLGSDGSGFTFWIEDGV